MTDADRITELKRALSLRVALAEAGLQGVLGRIRELEDRIAVLTAPSSRAEEPPAAARNALAHAAWRRQEVARLWRDLALAHAARDEAARHLAGEQARLEALGFLDEEAHHKRRARLRARGAEQLLAQTLLRQTS